MNEIDLLKGFRDDMPEPSTDAWLRARAAITAARTESAPTRKRASSTVKMRWFRPMYAATLAIVAIISATTGALLSRTPAPSGAGALTPSVSATGAVRALVADAIESDADNVVETLFKVTLASGTVDTGARWDYPWVGPPGSTVRQGGIEWQSGVPVSGWSLSFVVPPTNRLRVGNDNACQLTPRGITIDYAYRTWQSAPPPCVTLPPGLDLLVPTLQIVGFPIVQNQKTIELRAVSSAETFTLWINYVSYLPLQSQTTKKGAWTEQEQYTYQPLSPAIEAKLSLTQPAGFSQTQVQRAAS
jgi:hypothetical protein